jgi:hypothetical protein
MYEGMDLKESIGTASQQEAALSRLKHSHLAS